MAIKDSAIKIKFSTEKAIMLFAFLEHASINLVIPLLTLIFFDSNSPLFSHEASVPLRSFWYGIATAAYQTGGMIGSPFLGYISDYYGRVKLLKFCGAGVLLAAFFGMGSLFFISIPLLIISRLIGGVCVSNAVGQAAMGDLSTDKNKLIRMGYLQAAIALGAFVGPLLAAYLMLPFFSSFSSKLHFFTPYIASFIVALLGLYVLFVHFPKKITASFTQKNLSWENIKTVMKNRNVLIISLGLVLSQLSWSMYYQYITPLLKSKFNVDASHICLFFSLMAGYIVVGSTIGLKILKKFISTTEKTILIGSLLALFGLALTYFAIQLNKEYIIWIVAVPVGVGDVIAFSAFVTLYSDAVSSVEQGTVMGVCLIVRQLAWSLTGIIGGILFGIHLTLPLVVAPLTISILILWMIWHKDFFLRKIQNDYSA